MLDRRPTGGRNLEVRSVRIQLGSFGAWFNPTLDDDSRVRFAAEAEALGYGTAWLGLGRRVEPDLALVERVLDAT